MESSKHDWTLSDTATSLLIFFIILFLVPLKFPYMNFSEGMFYEYYLTSDFRTNTVILRRVCLPIKIASKSVIRSVNQGLKR